MFLPDFDGKLNLPFPPDDDLSLQRIFDQGLPIVSQALTRYIIQRTQRQAGGNAALFAQLAGSAFHQIASPSLPQDRLQARAPFYPDRPQRSDYFHISQGQMMAQMAAAIARASQRYL